MSMCGSVCWIIGGLIIKAKPKWASGTFLFLNSDFLSWQNTFRGTESEFLTEKGHFRKNHEENLTSMIYNYI